jgi:hypothetical protein
VISTLEILVLVVGSATLLALAYSSFWAFSIRKVLFEKIYRKRALWTGCFATYSGLEIALIVYLPYIAGSLAINIAWIVLGSALLLILTAWTSSTIKVVQSLDPFHRNRMKWRQSEKLVWLFSAIIVALNIFPALSMFGYVNYASALTLLGNLQLTLFVALFIYLILVAVSYQSAIPDRLMKAYIGSFLWLLIVLMLNIVLSPVSSGLGLSIGPFALTDGLLILSAFFMYRMSKSLVPFITKANF